MANRGAPSQLSAPELTLTRRLGQGGSATAWLARSGNHVFTLKVSDQSHRSHLAWEAERLILCGSRRLPRPVEVGDLPRTLALPDGTSLTKGTPYLLLEHVPGADLSQLPTDGDREALGAAVALHLAEALSDLHETGVAHGDVKPANVIVNPKGDSFECTLIDLGLAERTLSEHVSAGTPRYLPPEISRPELGGDARTRDLWAFGLTLLETLVAEARTADHPLNFLERCPASVRHIVTALLNPTPGGRPSADWVRRQLETSSEHDADRTLSQIRRSYLAERQHGLERIAKGYRPRVNVAGTPGRWLKMTCALLEDVARARGVQSLSTDEVFEPFDEEQQRKWLLRLLGTNFVDFPPLPSRGDEEWVEQLVGLGKQQPLQSITHAALIEQGPVAGLTQPLDDESLVLALGSESPSEAILQHAERRVFAARLGEPAALALGRVLKRRGASARALAVLRQCTTDAARVEEAAVMLRLGESRAADEKLAQLLDSRELEAEAKGAALAIRSRVALAAGDISRAAELLRGAPTTCRTLEAHAAIELTRGRLSEAKNRISRASTLAQDADDRARTEALLANCAQQNGDAEQALRRFRLAAEHAARAGSHLEEATYLVGVAGNATGLGRLSEAIAAASRSSLLFAHLEKPEAAARAVLSRASALACAGAHAEAAQAAEHTVRLARDAKDRRCQAYAHLVLGDVLEPELAREHVVRAKSLISEGRDDDALLVAAAGLRLGLECDVSALDEASKSLSLDARVAWWGARARAALDADSKTRPEPILTELTALASSGASVGVLASACAFGAELATNLGNGETARRLAASAAHGLERLRAHLPEQYRLSLAQKDWVKLQRRDLASDVSLEQLTDLETLIVSLSERSNLKALLDRVLDALILWTSVERGLLLLTAPGGKLVPRAARNLARTDLVGDQLKLSMSLAERAAETRQCVVAVDASGELPEVHTSVHSLKLRSVLAVPLLAKGEVLGVAYLDDRNRRGAFGQQELAWVELVGTLAAVAIADARSQLLLRRHARRARRAEERVTQLLATREAQLAVAQQELARSRNRHTRFSYDEIVGQSGPVQEMLQLVDRVTPSDIPVLVLGESGSGKELVARAVHFNGPRREAAFVSENCSAIPEALLESTLFGHVKGAFTGAARHHAGLFEVADGGTLFLDEIADMSLNMQAKLLRALENGEIRRVGDNRARRVDVRIIGATHKDLENRVERGEFREDLFYRLNVITIRVPALRERTEDIPLLLRHFLRKYDEVGQTVVSPQALERLRAHDWPGNIRQLENEVRRALVMADGEIRPQHLSAKLNTDAVVERDESTLDLRGRLDALERRLVCEALGKTNGNQTQAAQQLGVSRFGLQKMIRRLGIDIQDITSSA